MRIIETDINDLTNISPDENKIKLAESVINYVSPLLNNNCSNIVKEIKKLKETINLNNEQVKLEKNELEKLFKDFSKKEKESQLLKKMGKLIQTGLIQESMKTEMRVLLKSFENMSEERINKYLNETIKIISQKFAKS